MRGYAFRILKWLIILAVVLGLLQLALHREDLESWTPAAILFIGHPSIEAGIWRVSPELFLYRVPKGSLVGLPELVVPDPTTNRVAVVVHKTSGLLLPTILEEGKAYIWKGGEDFVFLKVVDTSINTPLDRDVVSRQLGLIGDSWGEDAAPIPFAPESL
jgi:hypothetical protein